MPRGRGRGPQMSNEKAKDFKKKIKTLFVAFLQVSHTFYIQFLSVTLHCVIVFSKKILSFLIIII